MIDHVIIGGFIKKDMQTTFLKELMIMMILRRERSRVEGGYKSKRLMTFSKSKRRSSL